MTSIDTEKKYFVEKCKFAKNGIKIVTGRNDRFYKTNNLIKRWKIKKAWREKVQNLLSNYDTERTKEQFLEDVSLLHEEMNRSFKGEFYRGDFSYYEALMSLSAALKYKWCSDNSCTKPPLCPINSDVRRILKKEWGALPNRDITKDIIDEIYECIIERDKELDVAIQGISIAEWELCIYNDILRKQHEN